MDESGSWRRPGILQIVQGLHPVFFCVPISPGAAVRRVTALVAHPRREGRYRLEVDGVVVATVDAAIVGAAGLGVGAAFDAGSEAIVAEGAARLAAFDKGLDALARRARSARELERWLVAREHCREHAAAAIERLVQLGFINDREFARSFARSRAVGRGMSRWRIQAELARRGVDRELADAAIAEVLADESVDEGAIVEKLARRKLRTLARLEPAVQHRRLYGFLARRGHDSGLVHRTVGKLLRPAQ